MAELVYAHDLKSCLERDVGSIPTPGTKIIAILWFYFCAGKKQIILLLCGKQKGSPIFLNNSYCEKMGNLYCPCNGRFSTPGTVDLIHFFWYFIKIVFKTI